MSIRTIEQEIQYLNENVRCACVGRYSMSIFYPIEKNMRKKLNKFKLKSGSNIIQIVSSVLNTAFVSEYTISFDFCFKFQSLFCLQTF